MIRHIVSVLVTFVLLAGCQSPQVRDEASPNFLPPKGTLVILHDDMQIPSQSARVFLQRGRLIGYYGLDRYYPWCAFEVNDVSDSTQILRANTFEIYRVYIRTEQVVENTNTQLAKLTVGAHQAWHFIVDGNGGGGPTTVTKVIVMWMNSPTQSNIRKLTCGGSEENEALARTPSVMQIRGALGNVATLELPSDQ
jgi:hypothetical protein